MEQQPDTDQKCDTLPRSPELMSRDDTALLVVDVQEKLIGLVRDNATIVWNIRRLLDAARVLGISVAATEQNPDKLGLTTLTLAKLLKPPAAKMAFSCGECGKIFSDWRTEGIYRVLLCGIETHVCIAQTAFDLTAAGFQVFVAADAVGARNAIDHEVALRRLETAGIVLTTTEAVIFEWCRTAAAPEFRQIMALAKETPPG
jgi:nicotinamidase-related amidase